MIPVSPCPCTVKTSFRMRHRPTDVSISSSPADYALLPISWSARTTSHHPAFIHPTTPGSSPGWPPSDLPATSEAGHQTCQQQATLNKKMKTKNITTSRLTSSINRSPLPRIFFLISVLLGCCFASAAAITVTNYNDNGPGSLRQALSDSFPGDTIDFDSSLNGQIIALTSGGLIINKNLIIAGPGASLLAIEGNQTLPVFFITPGIEVTISGLTIGNGFGVPGGGGIFNNGSLTVINSTLSGNGASVAGGGIYVTAGGSLRITNSILSGNSTIQSGGGIYNS